MQARGAETVERLLGVGSPQSRSWSARWAAATGDPAYLRAVSKKLTDPENGQLLWTTEESEAWRSAAAVQAERAMSTTDVAGGFLIPMQLDPAILLSSGGSANPLRAMARVIPTVGDVWYGVSSDGVDAHWYAEATEVSDDSPALLQPSIPCYRGSAWVPFSVEIEGDGTGFVTEVGRLLGDAVEQLTATAYVTGSGTGEPTGFITALAGGASEVDGDGSESLADSDPYKLQNALPPRFQANSQWGAAPGHDQRIPAGRDLKRRVEIPLLAGHAAETARARHERNQQHGCCAQRSRHRRQLPARTRRLVADGYHGSDRDDGRVGAPRVRLQSQANRSAWLLLLVPHRLGCAGRQRVPHSERGHQLLSSFWPFLR